MAKDRDSKPIRNSSAFKVGAIALVFMAIGFQVALFVRQAAVDAVVAHRDVPDTVYIVSPAGPDTDGKSCREQEVPGTGGAHRGQGDRICRDTIRRSAEHSRRAEEMAASPVAAAGKGRPVRSVESFAFDPNTVSVGDLQRLGFSLKQAQSIDSYRSKGGRFRRKSDFARSFVVSDSVYARLEPFIDIPLLDINKADSADFDGLPGIGPYFAAKMVEHRERLHGYSYPEQLMDIWRFDSERYEAVRDLVTVGPSEPYPLWSLPEDSLARHPYIGRYAARGVVLYMQNTPPGERSVMDLSTVLKPGMAEKLSRCRIAP